MINTTALANATYIRFVGLKTHSTTNAFPITQGWIYSYLRNNLLDVEFGFIGIGSVVTVVKDEDR